MSTPDLGACIAGGIAGFRRNPIDHVVASLLVIVVSSVALGLLTGPMLVGYMRMIEAEDAGQSPGLGAVFSGFDDFVPALLAGVLGSLIVSIGFMLCVVPGLLFLPLVPLAAYRVAMGEKDGVAAISAAWVVLKRHLLFAVFGTLILGLIGSLGFIACLVGALVTMPIAFIGTCHLARQLTRDGAANA